MNETTNEVAHSDAEPQQSADLDQTWKIGEETWRIARSEVEPKNEE